MKTVQTIIEDHTYLLLKTFSELEKTTISKWCKEAIEKELKKRELAMGIKQPRDY